MAGHEWDDWFEREEFIGQISDLRVQNLQAEREGIQKRTFTRWMNLHLEKCDPPMKVTDLFSEIQDGRILMALLEELSGCKLLHGFKRSSHRIFRLNNIAKVLTFLEERNVRLIGIDAADIADGNASLILGLIWNIILFFQIKELTGNMQSRFSSTSSLSSLPNSTDSETSHPGTPSEERRPSLLSRDHGKAIRTLLRWVQRRTTKYGVTIHDFGKCWKSGLAFLAVIKSIDPSLVDIKKAQSRTSRENLEEAFRIANYILGIPKLLELEDVMVSAPDEQSIMTYVSQFLKHFPEHDQEEMFDETTEERILVNGATSRLDHISVNGVHRNGDAPYVVKKDLVLPPPKIFISSVSDDSESACPVHLGVQEDDFINEEETSDSSRSSKRVLDLGNKVLVSPQTSCLDSAIDSSDSWSELSEAVLLDSPGLPSDSLIPESSGKQVVKLGNKVQEPLVGLGRPMEDHILQEPFIDEGIVSLSSMESFQTNPKLSPEEEDAYRYILELNEDENDLASSPRPCDQQETQNNRSPSSGQTGVSIAENQITILQVNSELTDEPKSIKSLGKINNVPELYLEKEGTGLSLSCDGSSGEQSVPQLCSEIQTTEAPSDSQVDSDVDWPETPLWQNDDALKLPLPVTCIKLNWNGQTAEECQEQQVSCQQQSADQSEKRGDTGSGLDLDRAYSPPVEQTFGGFHSNVKETVEDQDNTGSQSEEQDLNEYQESANSQSVYFTDFLCAEKKYGNSHIEEDDLKSTGPDLEKQNQNENQDSTGSRSEEHISNKDHDFTGSGCKEQDYTDSHILEQDLNRNHGHVGSHTEAQDHAGLTIIDETEEWDEPKADEDPAAPECPPAMVMPTGYGPCTVNEAVLVGSEPTALNGSFCRKGYPCYSNRSSPSDEEVIEKNVGVLYNGLPGERNGSGLDRIKCKETIHSTSCNNISEKAGHNEKSTEGSPEAIKPVGADTVPASRMPDMTSLRVSECLEDSREDFSDCEASEEQDSGDDFLAHQGPKRGSREGEEVEEPDIPLQCFDRRAFTKDVAAVQMTPWRQCRPPVTAVTPCGVTGKEMYLLLFLWFLLYCFFILPGLDLNAVLPFLLNAED